GHEAPLHPGRETRAAAAAKPRRLDRVDDRVLPDLHQLGGLVPITALLRRLQVWRLEAIDVREDAVLVRQRPGIAHQRTRFPPNLFCANMKMPIASATMIASFRSFRNSPK